MRMETATLGGGCFWCLEAVYTRMRGIQSVAPGYMGGTTANPTYEQVCGGRTGHAEVAQLRFDPAAVSYRDILEVFFATHDPTTLNRQGNDVGTQYRSVIFTHSEEQRRTAEQIIRDLHGEFRDPIVTEVRPVAEFYPAEDYHRRYFENNPSQPYCVYVITPKVNKFRQKFASRLKAGA